jgi:Predicted signal transduction protein with a C-terminal ATPase domain
MNFYETISAQVVGNEKLNEVLNTKYTGYLDVSMAYITYINKLSSEYTRYANSLTQMTIYSDNPTLICDNYYIKRLDENFMQTEIYKKLNSKETGKLAVIDTDGSISFYRLMNNDKTQHNKSVLNFKISSSVIREPLAGNRIEGDIFILDSEENHIVLNGKEENFNKVLPYVGDMNGSGIIEKRITKDDIIIYTTTNLGWKVIKIIKPTVFFTEAAHARNLVSLLLFISAFVLFFLIILISRWLTHRINILIQKINRVKHGDYSKQALVQGKDEIGQASSAMDDLTSELKYLIETEYTTRLANTKLELQNLQARINPHFLYNTLSGIDWYMQKDNIALSRDLLKSLTLFYRSSLERGSDIVTIADEIRLLQRYLDIELCLLENISASIDIPEEMLGIQINRMSLQPIVENAIKYAIKSSDEMLHIRVNGCIDGNSAKIYISDDGIGIPRKTAEEFNRNHVISSKGTGVGLINVDSRIKLQFGEKYGLYIKEKDTPGTVIILILPINTF